MIVADGLTKYYGLKPAIQEVSFRIDRGEIVGLLGPNGAGKTTILRILTCFMPPTQGSAKIHGLDTRVQGLKVRQKIGFLPENVPLYEDLRVRFFLSFAGAAKGLRGQSLRKEVDRVIQDCGLGEHDTRLIKHLSKGLKQRVGLAQALLGNPPILILDEPTTGLDPAQIVEIRQLIKNLGGERTILLSTHILPEVSQLCERVIILNRGRVVAEDHPQALTAKIQRGTRTLILVRAPQEQLMKKLASIKGITRIAPTEKPGQFLIESIQDETIRPLIAKTVVNSGWDLMEMTSRDLSLEEVFVHLVTEEAADQGGREAT
ncbi:MAG: ATP-binding cassette domain-containing protein [Deltaproteobacteria bacterium]|nr:ATP-binding cassette domain-containing protein [Deltaproteobacteria bacterium]MBW1928109.1 ATP-binding cassette domain-containing protein [Deltaproteobacteria bacterium]MBW2026804.1 ATP-binding cassette domain-containing protein [Deltaproteobacteria bacterium]MBW2126853.1 ATP-binding cassette domain-containing protein [Deltaproteobacteria bacterium]